MEEGKGVVKKRGEDKSSYSLQANTAPGRAVGNMATANYVQHIHILEQDLNLPPFKERVHLWTTIRVS